MKTNHGQNYKLKARVSSVSSVASSLHRLRQFRVTSAGLEEQAASLAHQILPSSGLTACLKYPYTVDEPNLGAFIAWVRLVWVGVNVVSAIVRE